MKLNLELPINNLSLGQVSYGLLREVFKRQLLPNIFPIGNVDVSACENEKPFIDWLQFCINRSSQAYSRKFPTIKIWHINGSERRLSDFQILWTPHETSTFTPTEQNIIKNQDVTVFTSNYSLDISRKNGLKNTEVCPNFFDSLHFKPIKDIVKPDAISFSLIGKFEKRKNTAQILQLWSKMYGKNEKYRLNCLINNQFIPQENWPGLLNQVFAGNIPWNINFIPFQEKNSQVNLIMNASDIDLSGLSGAEGFNLPCFNMLALNKIGVVLKAHAHLDYMDKGNSIPVEPKGMTPIYDGVFFAQGAPYNQGDMYVLDNDAAAAGIEEAVRKHTSKEIVDSTLESEFSVSNSVDKLLSLIPKS